MGKQDSSPSSSIDSSSHPAPAIMASLSLPRRDLSTELQLGLSITNSSFSEFSENVRGQESDWPPIKPLLRSRLQGKGNHDAHPTFYVKVYMDGVPIGRKLDLFAHDGYDGLTRTLGGMFKANILCPDIAQPYSNESYVLTYEDEEGDLMMVGDVPWELFLTTVKRLKITRGDKC